MPTYRIHRMKDAPRQNFRWAPHTSGVTQVKPKDYEAGEAVEGASPYAAWFSLRETDCPLNVGDLLESGAGELHIYKYVGFEEARWVLPELKTGLESEPLAAGGPAVPAN
ncbi:MAG: hypothetical protein SFV54_03290 [Bryobacteraceae bacterium]|nr:hypothetical protein [Bryobacteraceae bacterium]